MKGTQISSINEHWYDGNIRFSCLKEQSHLKGSLCFFRRLYCQECFSPRVQTQHENVEMICLVTGMLFDLSVCKYHLLGQRLLTNIFSHLVQFSPPFSRSVAFSTLSHHKCIFSRVSSLLALSFTEFDIIWVGTWSGNEFKLLLISRSNWCFYKEQGASRRKQNL